MYFVLGIVSGPKVKICREYKFLNPHPLWFVLKPVLMQRSLCMSYFLMFYSPVKHCDRLAWGTVRGSSIGSVSEHIFVETWS